MKSGVSKSIGFTAIISLAILFFCLPGQGYSQEDGTALMLEVSPVNGGALNLSPGVHTYDRDADVTLTAVPNPGYQFVYWLGDVTDATASTTTVNLDSPKIIIAVFQRSKFELLEIEDEPQISAGGGGLRGSGGDYARGGGSPVVKVHPWRWHWPQPPEPPESEGDVPVPEFTGDFPVPVPEPVTFGMMLGGALFVLKHKRRSLVNVK